MKYAVINFQGKERNNLGDQFLIQTSKNLLKMAGISEKDIIEIRYEDLPEWKSSEGSHVYLPVTFPFLRNVKIDKLFSEYIEPIFLGFFWADNELTEDEVKYLKKYEPIGCRDEYVYNTMKKYGIKAWLNGCATIINNFPFVEPNSERHLFLVDVPESIIKKIPDDILRNAKTATQIVPKGELGEETAMSLMIRQYQKYAREADRVVTTKLHCAMACLCMGIPTIMVCETERLPMRMAWLEKLLPIYTIEEISSINWNFTLCDISFAKKAVSENAVMLIKKPYTFTPLMKKITDYYENRERKEYFVEGYTCAVEYIEKNFVSECEIVYAFWGITIFTDMLQRYIKRNYPKARLGKVIDKYKKGKYDGVEIKSISETEISFKNIFLFVTAENAIGDAKEFIQKNGLVNYHLIV